MNRESNASSEIEDEEIELEEYDVEVIRDWRYNLQTKSREFFIKWRGYPEEDNTWEPEGHLNCPEPMAAFRKTLTKRQKAYFNARNPDDLTGLQRNAKIKSIVSDASSISLKAKAGTSKTEFGRDGCPFVLMIVFEDGEKQAEEVSLSDLFEHRQDDAFEWIEQRLISADALTGRRDVL